MTENIQTNRRREGGCGMGLIRTPEDIKSALRNCENQECDECIYVNEFECGEAMQSDALALIERLEAQRDVALEEAEKQKTLAEMNRILLEEAVKFVPEWISVEERLPPALVKVWMYSRRFDQMIQGMMSKSDPTLVFCEDGSDWRMSEITHWMPLPEPPKEGE